MDALAAGGVLFERAFTPAPVTLPAHTTHDDRARSAGARRARQRRVRAGTGPPTLAEALRARGLRSAAFVGGFPLVRRFGLARGFDHYDDAIGEVGGRALRVRGAPRRRGRRERARLARACTPGPSSSGCTCSTRTRPTIRRAAFRGPDPYRGRDRRRGRRARRAHGRVGRATGAVARRRSPPTTARPSASTERRATACSSTTPPCACRSSLRGPGSAGRPAGGRGGRDLRPRGHHRRLRGARRRPSCPAVRCAGCSTERRRSRCTRRRSRRVSTSDGATSAPGATGGTSSSARHGPSSTTSRPTPERRATSRRRPATSSRA